MATAKQTPRRRGLVVLGMHRSGTSALTRVLSLLGADLPGRLMPALPGINDQGFWESAELAEINDEILAAAGSSWDDLAAVSPSWFGSALARHYEGRAVDFLEREFGGSPLFILKDPRLCRLVPFWRSAFARFGADPRFVLTLRNPLEVAASLRKRGDTPASRALVLWLRYLLDAERGTRGSRRTFVSYDALLGDWRAIAAKLADDLDVAWPRGVEAAAEEVAGFLSDRHRHHRATPAQLAARADVPRWIPRIYALALEAEETGGDDLLATELDAFDARLAAALEALGPMLAEAEESRRDLERLAAKQESELAERQVTCERLRRERAEERSSGERLRERLGEREGEVRRLTERWALAEADLAAVLATRSWKVTAPIRWLTRSLRHLLGPRPKQEGGVAAVEAEPAAAPSAPAPSAEGAGAATRGLDLLPLFDTRYYLASYPDVRRTGMDPLAHFFSSGAREGRKVHHRCDGAKLAAEVSSGREVSRDLLSSCTLEFHTEEELSAHLSAELRLLKEIRDLDFVPQPLPMIGLATEEEAVAALRDLSLPAVADPVVSIVIPVYNQLKLTAECLVSLSRHTDLRRHEVVLVDDASEDFDPDVLRAVAGIRCLRNEVNVGFLKSCLQGAQAAAGDFLLFLNNDTQLTPGWLEALLETFSSSDDAGAVGPKLVFPDGRLQEAGAAVARDATSLLIGLGGDPASPRYNYRREVDYCSGACLLVRRSAWAAVDGFDRRFAPAYCEDVDLCFRLRRAGFKVLYEPRSVVIHHLSQTSAELSGRYKTAKVARNRRLLMETWAEEVERLNHVKLIAQCSLEPGRGWQVERAIALGVDGVCYQTRPGAPLPEDAPPVPWCLCHDLAGPGGGDIPERLETLRDRNYIAIGGRPLVLFQRAPWTPQIRETIERWRRRCRHEGVGDVYAAILEPPGHGAEEVHPAAYGCDAVVEHPLRDGKAGPAEPHGDERAMLRAASREPPGHPTFRAVAAGSSPAALRVWIESAVADARRQNPGDERLVFIDARSGWADGRETTPRSPAARPRAR